MTLVSGQPGSLVRMALCARLESNWKSPEYTYGSSTLLPGLLWKKTGGSCEGSYRTTLCSGHGRHRKLHSQLFASLLAYPLWPLRNLFKPTREDVT